MNIRFTTFTMLASAGLFIGTSGAIHAAEAPALKAYVVGEIDVKDAEGYKAYVAAATPLVAKFGGVYLARGGRTAAVEGAAPAGRVVVLQFPSLEAAQTFMKSPEYTKVADIRHHTASSRLFIVEGLAP